MKKLSNGMLIMLLGAMLLVGGCARGTALHRAAAKGDLNAAEKALLKGIGANARDAEGNTPLHYAARRDYSKILPSLGSLDVGDLASLSKLTGGVREMMLLDLLLENGADVNAVNEEGRTPLHVAAENNSPQVALFLMANGADPLAKDKIGRTPEELAIQHGTELLDKIFKKHNLPSSRLTPGAGAISPRPPSAAQAR